MISVNENKLKNVLDSQFTDHTLGIDNTNNLMDSDSIKIDKSKKLDHSESNKVYDDINNLVIEQFESFFKSSLFNALNNL